MTQSYLDVESPLGTLRLIAEDGALCALRLPNQLGSKPELEGKRDPILKAAAAQLREYFAGRRQSFDLPLSLGGSAFQKAAWKALQKIPFGQTRSYGDQARAIARPQASRAVGGANHRNPIAIIVPCHRVIGSDGSLTGYGGGEPTKRWLLEHEARVLAGGKRSRSRV
ncbi:MAG TPA: methylated-DNA--[protein]-cysteine S-methyltransferase [Polyangiaceae bacterium]